MKYAVTINCNVIPKSTGVDQTDRIYYAEHLRKMRNNGIVLAECYEVGKQGRCHVHCTWETDRTKKEIHELLKAKTFYYDCKPVESNAAWNTYIHKNQSKDDAKLIKDGVKLITRLVNRLV